MASASIEDKGGGKWRVRWREKRVDGDWRPREVTVDGCAEDAEAYRLDVFRDLRRIGRSGPRPPTSSTECSQRSRLGSPTGSARLAPRFTSRSAARASCFASSDLGTFGTTSARHAALPARMPA